MNPGTDCCGLNGCSTTQTIEHPQAAANPRTPTAPAAPTANPQARREGAFFTPAADVIEARDAFVITLDMPGCHSNSIEVTLDRGVLTVRGSVHDRPAAGRPLAREYGVGDFYRSFRVSADIDPAAIQAHYALGVLTLTLPKVQAARRVAVKVTSN